LAGNFHPFDSVIADDLVAQWQANTSNQPGFSQRELMLRIAADAIADPLESDYHFLGLQPYQLFKRKAFVRHFRSSQTYVWKRLLMTHLPNLVEQTMDGVQGVLLTAGHSSAKSGNQTRLDMLLYDEIVDNFSEEGFLSVALQVVQRVLGDIEENPDNLVFSVDYAGHLDRRYQLLQEQIPLSAPS
jgi:hypothetical protein